LLRSIAKRVFGGQKVIDKVVCGRRISFGVFRGLYQFHGVFSMHTFRNILFPTDYSQHARSALKYAAAFARQEGGRVIIFSVQQGSVPANLFTVPDRAWEDSENEWLKDLRDQVRDLMKDPLLAGLGVEPIIAEGNPANEIARAVREFDIDLITIATHGRKGLSRALWGSTTEEIIAESACPVLSIRPPQRDFVDYRESRTEIRLNRIMLATDFRPSAEVASEITLNFAKSTGAEVHLVHVIDDMIEQMSDSPAEGEGRFHVRHQVEEKKEEIAKEAGVQVVSYVTHGRPSEEINRIATEKDVDLILLGTSVHSSIFGSNNSLGPEIERVLRNAPCPVLCAPISKETRARMTLAPERITV
jgi:nucleotide-binding universal stress UspA family protein